MAVINLVRVDDRLIHGQVMQVWSKGHGTNAIFVVDDETASDEFMKDIYESAQSTGAMKIKVFSSDEIIEEWNKNQFGDYKLMIVYKNVRDVAKSVAAGVELPFVDIGGLAMKNGTTRIIDSVGLNEKDAESCREIAVHGVEVFFQNIPSSEKVSLADALKKLQK